MKIPYNIGDFIRSRRYRTYGWSNCNNYTNLFNNKYPNSICNEYTNLNINDKQTLNKYYDDDNINYKLLNKIVKQRSIKHNINEEDYIYIYLRIGDSIDKLNFRPENEYKDYKIFLKKQQTHWNGLKYVYPLQYYINIEKKIEKLKGKKNIKIIAYNYDKGKICNSYKYTMEIYKYFINKGYSVEIMYNDNVDIEFITLCNSKYFVPGLGGFSFLIQKIRLLNNKFIF